VGNSVIKNEYGPNIQSSAAFAESCWIRETRKQ